MAGAVSKREKKIEQKKNGKKSTLFLPHAYQKIFLAKIPISPKFYYKTSFFKCLYPAVKKVYDLYHLYIGENQTIQTKDERKNVVMKMRSRVFLFVLAAVVLLGGGTGNVPIYAADSVEDSLNEQIVENTDNTEKVTVQTEEEKKEESQVKTRTAGNGSSLEDWDYQESIDGKIIVTGYKGQSTDIVIPGQLEGREVAIDSMTVNSIQNIMTTLTIGTEAAPFKASNVYGAQFYDCPHVKKIDMRYYDTSDYGMAIGFMQCPELTEVDLSGEKPASYPASLFRMCPKLSKIKVDGLQVSSADTAFQDMFTGFPSLQFVDLSKVKIASDFFIDDKIVAQMFSAQYMGGTMSPVPLLVIGNSVFTQDLDPVGHWNQFARKPYEKETVSYNANGGAFDDGSDKQEFSPIDGVHVIYQEDEVRIPKKTIADKFVPSREGYMFTGWYLDQACKTPFEADDSILDFTLQSVDSFDLYAGWKENTYTVKYETGFDDVTIEDRENVKWDDADLLPENPKKGGYRFDGWEWNGKTVSATDKYSDLTSDRTDGTSVTLRAKWSELTDYSVAYDPDGGSMPENTPSEVTGMKYTDTIAVPTPAREGYQFQGWIYKGTIINETVSYQELEADDSIKRLTLVAKWKINSYSVSYEFVSKETPDGVKIPESASVEYGKTADEPVFGAYEKWSFDGWYLDKEMTKKYDFSTPVKEDMKLYGAWTKEDGKPDDKPDTKPDDKPDINPSDKPDSGSGKKDPVLNTKPNNGGAPADKASQNSSRPKTGDSADAMPFVAAACGSLAVFAAALVWKKKRSSEI